ncbi:hypothetical protein EMCRGX_G019280 [Ephydatia muelleri]
MAVLCHNTDCVKKLLLAPGIDVNIKDRYGRTPVMLASGNYEMLTLLRSCSEFPVHTFSKVILCGNSGAGKSTLAQNLYKAAEPSKPLTAGIIPYNIQSQHGNMVLYDMADVSLKQEEIIKQIHYWSTMISSVCSKCPHPSEVIVMGTHVDKVQKKDLLCRTNIIEDLAITIFNNQHYRGFIALDATARFSDNMKRFIGVLSESNDTVVQQSPVISTDCHILYAFLQQRVPSDQVITISYLLSELQADKTNVLPTETSTMIPLLTTLSAKGLILFILNKRNPDGSWIVVQKNMLLERVAGVLFAPKVFGEYRALASNTGLVPITKITECFPDLDAHMLVQFLSQLKLCHLVDSTLKIVDTSQTSLDLTRDSTGSHYSLFFPSLIDLERPASFDPTYINTKGSFGWLMRTKKEHQFFHNRFLHVLMLTLMNACDGIEALCNPLLQSLNRQCIVWSTGMCWNNEHGVTILFDMVEQFRSLYVAVTFPGPQYQELTILYDIRKTFSQFCSSIDVEELVIDPRQVCALFNKGVMPSSLPCVEMSKLKNAILSKSDAVCDFKGNVVAIAEWIRAESHLPKLIGIEHEDDLFDVYREVLDVAAVWSDIGLALRMQKPELDVICESHPLSPKDCLKAVLSGWLQGRNRIPTWGALCEAVAEPAGGNNRTLAEEIACNHGVTLKPSKPQEPEPSKTSAYLEQVVTLRDIGCIKYKPPGNTDIQILHIEHTISAHWERLAQQLGIDHDECTSIAMAKLQDPGRCLSEVISRWLNRNGRKNTTWNHFLTFLRDSGLEAPAEELENALQNRAV